LTTLTASVAVGLVSASGDETTIGYSPLRTNWDNAEPQLTSTHVTQPDFGRLWSTTLPGTTEASPNQLYAQPLVVGGKVIVATEENQVDALDAATGAVLWTSSLGPAWTPTPTCGDLTPHIGITSTPVYDPSTQTVYVVAKTNDGVDASHPNIRMHALSAATGAERTGWPLLIQGTSTNSGLAFNAATVNTRPGLLLMGGGVFFATASHCDHGPYVGFVGRVAVGTMKPTLKLWSSESGSGNNEAGIWQSGGGPMSDGPGRVFIATGNGVSPTPAPGASPPGTLAESVVRLAVGADGTMTAKDFFSPANNAKLDQDDADLGSGSPVALPDDFGSGTNAHLLVLGGKDGTSWLLNRDNLGGNAQGPGGTDAAVSSVVTKGLWGRAAVFDGGTGAHLIYIVPSTSPMQALSVGPNGAGVPTLTNIAATSQTFAYTAGSPVVTSNGGDGSTAVVWTTSSDGATGTNGMLEAYPAIPPSAGAWTPLASFPLGTIAKFIQPATDNGRVFVTTRDGRVLAFGEPTTGALTGASTNFGLVPVGGSSPQTVTLTASGPVTVSSLSAASPFTVGTPSPALPATLAAGATLTVPVTFAPTAPGTSTGSLSVVATPTGGAVQNLAFGLAGTGTQTGIAAAPEELEFKDVAIGRGAQLGVTIQNTGSTSTTLAGATVSDPGGDGFALVGSTPTGTVLAPQGSVTVTVGYTPTRVNPSAAGTLTVSTQDGHSAVVPLSGSGFTGTPALTFSGPRVVGSAINFGNVAPGSSLDTTVTLTNTGTSTMVINKAAPPTTPFVVTSPINEGQTVEPGDSLTIPISVSPASAKPFTDHYSVTTNDGLGAHLLTLTVNTSIWSGSISNPLGCITVKDKILLDHTPIVQFDCNGSTAQRFMYVGSTITLYPPYRIWCVDVPSASVTRGQTLQLYHCNGSVAQQWSLDSTGRFYNAHSKLCLEAQNGADQPNTPLVIDTCTASPSEQWDISAVTASRGQVSSGLGTVNQYCVTDTDNVSRDGTPLDFAPCTTAPGQVLTRVGSTFRVAGGCLTLARPVARASVWLQQCNGSTAQQWTVGAGGSLVNPASKLCLDEPHSSVITGTHLWAYTCNGSAAQRWTVFG